MFNINNIKTAPLKKFTFLALTIGCLWITPYELLASQPKITEAQAKAMHEWSYSLALQAANYGAPLVTMYSLRYNDALTSNPKAKPNEIWRMENISTPELSREAGYVTPNVNTIYGFGFMDIRKEPIILEVPDSNNLYYMVEIVDMWTNAFAYVGGKTTGYKGGKFALVGPGWQGTLPPEIKRIDAPTPWVLLQPRVHIYQEGKIDLDSAKSVLANIKTLPLSVYAKTSDHKPLSTSEINYQYPAPEYSDPNLPVSALQFKDPLQFWELFVNAMNENPPPKEQIDALLPMFVPLGIELGKPWDRTKLLPVVVEAMREAAGKIGSILANIPFGTIYKGAFIPPPTIGNSGTDYLTRAVVARVGLTANTPYEAIYWMYPLDDQTQMLNGNNKYTMTFKEGLPYYEPGFWSVTLYDATNNYTVPNPINRYMLGSDTHDLKKNEDGSFTIYIQKESPGNDLESNWLPAPKGYFYLILRSYAPKEVTIEILSNVNAWPIPTVIERDSK